MAYYYLGVDQGTTNTKVVLLNGTKIISKAIKKIPITFTKEGWVEQDPVKMIQNIIFCIKYIIKKSKINIKKIKSVGISNQTETLVVWDKKKGKPIMPAISWQCKRSSALIKKYKSNFNLNEINKKTGLNLDATFTATKIFWIKKKYPKIYNKIITNKYLVGTIDTWIIWNLTNGKVYATDASNASRTLLCDIKKVCWDKSLLNQFELKKLILPEIKNNQDNYGEIDKKYFGTTIKIRASIGDQQASLYGNGCLKQGDLKITLGTGAFLWLNKGSKFIPKSNTGCLETLAWKINKPVYASEGFILMAGALLDYFINNLRFAKDFTNFEKMASKIEKNDILIVPSILGMGTPWWSLKSNGTIYGLNSKTTRDEICLSVFETVGFQIKSALDALKKHSHIKIKRINIDGKLSSSKLMKKILSKTICKEFNFSANSDITARGAALLASNKKKFQIEEIKYLFKKDKIHKYLNDKYIKWKKLTESIINFE